VDLQLEGKVALVTGGNRGLGKAIAAEFGRNGMDVAILARNWSLLTASAETLARETGRRVLPFQADTTDEAEVKRAVEAAAEAFGRIDVLVNSAARASTPGPSALEQTDENILADFHVKVLGYLHVARAVAPYMRKQGWGRIINLSGMGALLVGNLSTTIRNVSVVSLTKTLANELAPQGIGVVCIHPSNVYTDNFEARFGAAAQRAGLSLEQYARRLGQEVPIGRMVNDADIAYAATMLASPRASAICGETIVVNGGAGGTIRY
jgi:NAD(P)-dependent dehydrogenase (short-subunit alcohol dehydrogenase family)